MGQNSSSSLHTSTATLPRARRPGASEPVQPAPAPSSTPPPDHTPKTPPYLVPENKVIPNGTIGIVNARRHLRPVSQDLAKLHPEYADVFRADSAEKRENGSIRRSTSMPGLDKENDFGLSKTLGEIQGANGHIRALSNAATTNGGNIARSDDNISMTSSDGQEQWNSLKRAQSADMGVVVAVDAPSKPPYRHSRQTSLASRMSLQDTVILEDPREHLYNLARKEPFSNFMPNTASLPVKSTFDMDYSFNLTYAQLAEHRRQKRTADLEERTGKKLEALSADISSASTVPKSPFDLRNLGGKPSTHSLSTGSSDTGVSKSKKKKAPAPPPPAIPPFRYTLADEPPVDYEAPNPEPAQQKILRSNSSASAKPKAPAPQPFPKRHSATALFAAGQSDHDLGSSNQVPLPPSLSALFNKPKPKPQNDVQIRPPGFDQLQKSKAATQMQLEALKRLEETLKKVEPAETVSSDIPRDSAGATHSQSDLTKNGDFQNECKTEENSPQKAEHKNIATANQTSETPTPPAISPLTSSPAADENSPLKTMSSLLQHDIIRAAQARGTKILKPKIPSASEKPKDPTVVFQEELAKAAQAREERRKLASANETAETAVESTKSEDEDRVLLFESGLLKVTKSPSKKINDELNGNSPGQDIKSFGNSQELDVKASSENEDSQKKEADEKSEDRREAELDEIRIAESVDMSKRGSIQSEAMSVDSSNHSQRFASDWIPEVDLDSDDDIMDERATPTHKRVSSEGFKSSILPSKLNDMKKETEEKTKKKKKSQMVTRSDSNGNIPSYPPADEKSKFGSVRKFKQGMRSALGSISKASGKLFKKPKSRDKYKAGEDAGDVVFAQSDDGRLREFLSDKNWTLSESRTNSLRRYDPKPASTDEDLSSGPEDDDVADIDFAGGIDQLTPRGHREVDSDETGKGLKRAGVAYVSKKGQIIVLPEYNYGISGETSEDEEGRAPKIVKKKNRKFTYESTVRVQEKNRIELEVAREILEKEKQIEVERQRQQSMEREFKRLRELETQERLQRLQSDTMKDQISLIQQQRAAQFEINNNVTGVAPQAYHPYFPNGTVGLVGNPGFINSTMPTLLPMGLPTNYTTHSSPLVGGGGVVAGTPASAPPPQLTAHELSRISEYMRQVGVVPPSNQQQWAVLLSTISYKSPGIPPVYDQKTALYGMGTGPNLSHFFGGAKTMDSAAPETSGQLVSFVPAPQGFRDADALSQDRGEARVRSSLPSPAHQPDMSADHSTSDSPLKSPPLSSQVYGPLGYRPVSFHNHVT